MFVTRLAIAALVLLTVSVLGLGLGVLGSPGLAQAAEAAKQDPAAQPAAKNTPAPTDRDRDERAAQPAGERRAAERGRDERAAQPADEKAGAPAGRT